MAAKTSCHRYETELRDCHPVYINVCDVAYLQHLTTVVALTLYSVDAGRRAVPLQQLSILLAL